MNSRLLLFLILVGSNAVVAQQPELPITEIEVFIQSGEVTTTSAIVMTRCNAEMEATATLMMFDTAESQTARASSSYEADVSASSDYTASFLVEGLEPGTMYTYKVECGSSSSDTGSFTTAPAQDDASPFSFVWVADLAGQGWGRNPDFSLQHVDGRMIEGGYVVFDTMQALEPQLALFQGDMIYADNAIAPTKNVSTGGVWVNNPSKDFIAVTLDEFRANWKYNFGDEKMQQFLLNTPVYVQWDDHEVTNNWWPNEVLGNPLYDNGTEVNLLFENSLAAFYEYNPIIKDQKLYRKQRFGKHVEIFFPDYRSYREPNPENSNPEGSSILGEEQFNWLVDSLKTSTATWKIISSHDPFGVVTGGEGDRDAFGQEDPAILGREVEFQKILQVIYDNDITGVVSLTSDVHFTAHVNMHPDRAQGNFTDFKPLDEFVIGPIHAGSFGPNFMDTSFGAQYEYEYGPLTAGFERWANLPPSHYDLQSFGHAAVSEDGTLEIKLLGIDGSVKFEKTLSPPGGTSGVESVKSTAAPLVSGILGLVFAGMFLLDYLVN